MDQPQGMYGCPPIANPKTAAYHTDVSLSRCPSASPVERSFSNTLLDAVRFPWWAVTGSNRRLLRCKAELSRPLHIRVQVKLPPYGLMVTGVPSLSSGLSRSKARSPTRRQPALADVPIELGALVPCIASWSPPDHPTGSFG